MCRLRSISNLYRQRKEMEILEGDGKRGLEPQGTVSVDADVSFEERGLCLYCRVVFNCLQHVLRISRRDLREGWVCPRMGALRE